MEQGCSLEAWLDFWRLLAAARGCETVVMEMLYRVGFRPISDSSSPEEALVATGEAAVPPRTRADTAAHMCDRL